MPQARKLNYDAERDKQETVKNLDHSRSAWPIILRTRGNKVVEMKDKGKEKLV